jgi:hypothetical protein
LEDLRAYVGTYDPAVLPRAAFELEVTRANQMYKLVGTLRSMNAARVASAGSKDQKAQAIRDMAAAAGTSRGQAEKAAEAGRAMAANADIDAAARGGELSPDQLGIIADAQKSSPEAASELVRKARTSSLRELAEEAARLCAEGEGAEQRRRAVHAARSLRHWTGPDGTWNLRANGTPEDGAIVMAAVNAFGDKAFEAARKEDRHEGPAAYGFDGLVGLARFASGPGVSSGSDPGPDASSSSEPGPDPGPGSGSGSGSVPARSGSGSGPAPARSGAVSVRIDYDTLMRGYALHGEVCETVGFGPTTPQAVMDLLATGDPFIKVVVTRAQDVVGVVNLGRRPNRAQMTALEWMYPACAAQGCSTRACWLQSDHRADWAKTRYTLLDLIDRLCPLHHRLKTYKGWMLVVGKGKRAFVPPEDPRHPGPVTAPPRPGPGTNASANAGTDAGTSTDARTNDGEGEATAGRGPSKGTKGRTTAPAGTATSAGIPTTDERSTSAPDRARRSQVTDLRLDIDNCDDDVARSEHGP